MVEAFPWATAPKYLVRDRDGIYGNDFVRRVPLERLEYYERSRTHLGPSNDCPVSRRIEPPDIGSICEEALVRGLHHRYFRSPPRGTAAVVRHRSLLPRALSLSNSLWPLGSGRHRTECAESSGDQCILVRSGWSSLNRQLDVPQISNTR